MAALEAELAAVYASRSWRLTRVLRAVSGALPRRGAVNAAATQAAPQGQPDMLERLDSLAAWRSFAQANTARISREAAARIVDAALSNGIVSRFFGSVPASGVSMVGMDAREGLMACNLNSRQRAVLELFAADPRSHSIYGCRIYAHEGVTAFALALRGRYPFFLGSEYAPTAQDAAKFWPVPSVDIARSPFPDASFDVVLSNDVLEHVPELDATLRDTARILKPSGRLIAHFPFLWDSETTQVRAVIEGGAVRHILPPEYHGNPVDTGGGSLVFQLPGWDILARCRNAGFRDARMVFLSSATAGITASEIAGHFVLEAER